MAKSPDIERIGRYQVHRVLGEGAMGVVYAADDPLMHRRVAIKTMNEEALERPELRERFYQEARALANLEHEGILRVFDIGDEAGLPFMVMEYLGGSDLETLLEEGEDALSMKERLDIAYQIARALQHAHEQGVVHRDIKPSNVRILEDNRVKLLDFGIAKVAESENVKTVVGTLLGTPEYMSPEQARGQPADGRSDIFSFGVVLYELLTHRRPFTAESALAVLNRVREEPHSPMRRLVNGEAVPEALEKLVDRCLDKSPDARPGSLAEVCTTLRETLKTLADPYFFEPLRAEQIKERLVRAENLLDRGEYKRARSTLRRLRGAKTYAAQVEALQERCGEVAEVVESVERGFDALAALDFDRVEEVARQALEQVPSYELAGRLLEQVQRARQIDRFVAAAKAALEAGDFAGAKSSAAKALELDEEHQVAADLLQQAEVGIERQRRIADLLTRAREARESGRLERAAELARSALEEDSEHSEATEFLATVEAEIEAERRRQQRIRELIERAHKLAESGEEARETEALDCLVELLEIDPEHREAAELRQRIEARRKAREERRRRRERAMALLAEAREAQSKGDLERAGERARAALEEDADLGEAVQLLEVIEAQIEKERERRQRIAELLKDAAEAQPDEEGEARAMQCLAQVLELDPRNERALKLRREIDQRRQAREAAERQRQQVASLISGANRAFRDNDLEVAARMARSVLSRAADNPQAKELLRKVEAAIVEKKKRERTIARLLEEAEGFASKKRASDAQRCLERLLELDPEHPRALQLLAQAEEQLAAVAAAEAAAAEVPATAAVDVEEAEVARRSPAATVEVDVGAETVLPSRQQVPRTRVRPPETGTVVEAPDGTVIEAPSGTVFEAPGGTVAEVPGGAEAADEVAAGGAGTSLLDYLPESRPLSVRVRSFLATTHGRMAGAGAAVLLLLVVVGIVVSGGEADRPVVVPSPGESAPGDVEPRTAGPEETTVTGDVAADFGLLAIDAAPWAWVRRLENAAGDEFTPGEPTATPVALRVPPGRYTVTLEDPRTGAVRTARVEVERAGVARVRQQMEPIDVRAYLRRLGQ